MVPGLVMYYQALSFVHWDRADVAPRDTMCNDDNGGEIDLRLRHVESDFCDAGVVYDSSGLHYSQQAYCHQLLRTLCRCDDERSLESSPLLEEADRVRDAWVHSSSPPMPSSEPPLPDYASSALRCSRDVADADKVSPGPPFVAPFRDSFESDLLCAYEVYRCVSEMRAERRLGALDASKVSTSKDVLRALVRKEYASNRFERVGPRDWYMRTPGGDEDIGHSKENCLL